MPLSHLHQFFSGWASWAQSHLVLSPAFLFAMTRNGNDRTTPRRDFLFSLLAQVLLSVMIGMGSAYTTVTVLQWRMDNQEKVQALQRAKLEAMDKDHATKIEAIADKEKRDSEEIAKINERHRLEELRGRK